MKRVDFDYELPEHLIARFPPEARGGSRLLVLDGLTGVLADRQFSDLPELLSPGDLLVFNNTRVMPARIYGRKSSGARLELLVERLIDAQTALVHLRASRAPKVGANLILGQEDQEFSCTLVARQDTLFLLQLAGDMDWMQVMECIGHMPLPPYIDRADEALDAERYQTVFAERPGAVAAPTAGLHFTEDLLAQLTSRGIETGFVTLHVGAGTFQPVRVDNVSDHQMHSEYLEVSPVLCEQVRAAKARGGRVVAVGTTSVRCLETAAASGSIQPYRGDTRIFIYPGYQFQCIDALVTNFHLPESTLIMLVSAFAGYEHTMAAYRHAVAAQYRFFSYGDAMFITPQTPILALGSEQSE